MIDSKTNMDAYLESSEFPFKRKGMTFEEFMKEFEHYGNSATELRKGTYKPLWKQKEEADV